MVALRRPFFIVEQLFLIGFFILAYSSGFLSFFFNLRVDYVSLLWEQPLKSGTVLGYYAITLSFFFAIIPFR